jgi:hypothetical protein
MDQDFRAGRHRLPGYAGDQGYSGPRSAATARIGRDEGVRRVRRTSNWTAAALVAGVAVTTGYFAHAATVASQQASPPGTVNTGQPAQPGTIAPGHKASLTHPVVTSGGSGVTAGGGGASGGGGSHGGDY